MSARSFFRIDAMRNALVVQYEREEEQRRLWEAGEDEAVLGQLKRADGEPFDVDAEIEDIVFDSGTGQT